MRTTAQLREVWHPPCQRQGPLAFTFWNGVRVGIDGRIIEALKALDTCLKRWNYRPKEGQTWGYNCRRITGGTGYSLHAYGIAVDINSLANPYGPTLKTDMPPAMVAAIKSIKTKGGHRVWAWGGDYSRNKDAMHYEVVASPAELAQGIDWRTIAGTSPAPAVQTQTVTPPTPLPQEDDMLLLRYKDQFYQWYGGRLVHIPWDHNHLISYIEKKYGVTVQDVRSRAVMLNFAGLDGNAGGVWIPE
jgi:hypothetical protein